MTFATGPTVLEGIDLAVEPGEFVSVIGPSGCGKSTLLRLIAGLETPTQGTVTFTSDAPRPPLAYLFQDATLLPWLTAQGNIETPLKLAGLTARERATQARALAELVGLSEALDRYPRQLSGGMQMRVSLARALAKTPAVMLLDEPFGALDALTRHRLNEELITLQQAQGWTAFFVTHSINEAVFLSQRIVMLAANPGRVAEVMPIELPFPRNAATRATPAYQAIVATATQRFQEIMEDRA